MRRPFPWRFLLYGLYAVLLITVLLYVRFPAERFRQFCENSLQSQLTSWNAKIENVSFQPPTALVFNNVILTGSYDGLPSQLVFDRVMVKVNPGRLSVLDIEADLFRGRLTAALALDRRERSFRLEEIRLTGLALAEALQSLGMVERELAGNYDFTGDYQADWDTPLVGRGQGRVEVSVGKMGLVAPLLSLAVIDINSLTAAIEFHGGEVELADGQLRGRELRADFSGTVLLASSLPRSQLRLKGLLQPEETFLQANPREQMLVQRLRQRYNASGVPFQVGGTLTGPTFRFGGN
jgi:type II secretion system protein N